MRKIAINSWKWLIEDTALLNGWFDRWQDFARNCAVKQNPVRIVFKIEDLFYIKLENPKGLFKKLRNFFSPKAYREFHTGRALEEAGIPVVKHLGWAKNGSKSMLMTESIPDARSVLEYWYSEIIYGNVSTKKFLESFADFLKLFFESGFYHPDFHIGNILYSPQKNSFSLVDVYGIYRPEKLSLKQKNKLFNIIIELYRGLNDTEAVNFIRSINSDFTIEEAEKLWINGLKERADRTRKDWQKRQLQIEENYPKFIESCNISGDEFLIRKQPGPINTVKLENIPSYLNGNHFDLIHLPAEEAEELWRESFRLELLGIDHIRPLVFEKPNILYFEKTPDGTHKADVKKSQEYISRSEILGEKINTESILQFPNERTVIRIYNFNN
jgi:hypothetical protein